MLNQLTIAEAHNKLRAKEISSKELVQSCIDRIESVDSDLNAVVHKEFDPALAEAEKADSKSEFSHPLEGIPFLAKDVFNEKGRRSTGCSNVLRDKDYLPPFESTTTDRLKEKGAICLGKTNTDEFTMGASTETSCFGVTRNPWDTSRVAGGSSGGSAAAIGADECLFTLGTDTGGSIRQPAAFCNATGLRPTYGRTSRYGVMSMASSLDAIGPITKNVEDLAIVLEAIAGKDTRDATTSDIAVPAYHSELESDLKGKTIGLPSEYFIEGLKEEVEQSVRDAVKVFESLGASVKEISLPHTKYALPTYYVICPSEVSSNMARYDGVRYGHKVEDPENLIDNYFKVRSEGFGDEVKRRIMIGTFALSAGYYDAYYRQAQKVRTLIKQDFDQAFEQVDLIVSPATPHPAFTVGANDNDPVAMYLEDVFVAPHVMAGVPALALPCGFTKENLPLGFQIVGPQWEELRVLQAGHAYQKETDWHTRKPDIS